MALECNYCGKELGKSYAKCGKCEDRLHFGGECSGVKKADWETMGPIKKSDWNCNFCNGNNSTERPAAARPTRPSNAEKKGEIGYNEDESEKNDSDDLESNDDEDYTPKGKKRRASKSPKKAKAKTPTKSPRAKANNNSNASNDEVLEMLTDIKSELQGLGSIRKELTDLRKSFDTMSKKYDEALEEIKQLSAQQNDKSSPNKAES